MSETFLVAFERRDRFDHSWDDARPWLLGIATNLLRRHHRTESRMLQTLSRRGAAARSDDHADAVASRVDAAAGAAAIARALGGLSRDDRECLLLYAWADLTYEGIAQATGVPIGTVRSRLNRARRILRDAAPSDLLTVKEDENGRAHAPARNAH